MASVDITLDQSLTIFTQTFLAHKSPISRIMILIIPSDVHLLCIITVQANFWLLLTFVIVADEWQLSILGTFFPLMIYQIMNFWAVPTSFFNYFSTLLTFIWNKITKLLIVEWPVFECVIAIIRLTHLHLHLFEFFKALVAWNSIELRIQCSLFVHFVWQILDAVADITDDRKNIIIL